MTALNHKNPITKIQSTRDLVHRASALGVTTDEMRRIESEWGVHTSWWWTKLLTWQRRVGGVHDRADMVMYILHPPSEEGVHGMTEQTLKNVFTNNNEGERK